MEIRSTGPAAGPGHLRTLIAGLLAGAWTGVLFGLLSRPASPSR